MQITQPGLYDMTMAEYLADPCPEPSFSASCGKTLMRKSPRHAWREHPRLGNLTFEPPNARADFGSVVHELVLGNGSLVRVIDAPNFLTKAAKEARDQAIADGHIPMKSRDYERAQSAAAFIREQMAPVFKEGIAEQTMIWRDGETWCRARPDWLIRSANMVFDLKITATDLSPLKNTLARDVYDKCWYDLTAAHYMDGYQALFGEDLEYRFIFVENEPPFSIVPANLSGQGIEMGKRKLIAARSWWKRCMKDDVWPGISSEIRWLDPEPWQAAGWLTYDSGMSDVERETAIEFNRPLEDT